MGKRKAEESPEEEEDEEDEEEVCHGCGETQCTVATGKWAEAWWACQECELWYHSSCCGLTQPQVRSIQKELDNDKCTDKPAWHCRKCDPNGKRNSKLARFYTSSKATPKPSKASAAKDKKEPRGSQPTDTEPWKWTKSQAATMVKEFGSQLARMRRIQDDDAPGEEDEEDDDY
eukprot:TRINITY_DN15707_c2_g1_i1.p1 TRINITY_DN15707_c2_g1~~TRINITY_DN15707_c2_g1_i1.p1  ORF type:complete len:174 (+),score=30.72 TRINITY_DN15707_c2_g1_i1:237-758(+)